MSLQAAQQFFAEVVQSDLLQEKLDSVSWTLDRIIEIAAQEGYYFTAEEIETLLTKRSFKASKLKLTMLKPH